VLPLTIRRQRNRQTFEGKKLLLIDSNPTFLDVIKWNYSIHFTGFFYSWYT